MYTYITFFAVFVCHAGGPDRRFSIMNKHMARGESYSSIDPMIEVSPAEVASGGDLPNMIPIQRVQQGEEPLPQLLKLALRLLTNHT